jgi:hypothetical protein
MQFQGRYQFSMRAPVVFHEPEITPNTRTHAHTHTRHLLCKDAYSAEDVPSEALQTDLSHRVGQLGLIKVSNGHTRLYNIQTNLRFSKAVEMLPQWSHSTLLEGGRDAPAVVTFYASVANLTFGTGKKECL